MKHKILLFACFVLIGQLFIAQPFINTQWMCKLPFPIRESSGLYYAGDGILWTHGDSDTRPVIYTFDTLGVLIDSMIVAAQNIDWEALAVDDSGNLFIGDFGNNLSNRTDLHILKIRPDTSEDTLIPEIISFSYPDQHQFPGSSSFDCEAMYWYKDSLFLISKNFLLGGNGKAKLYGLSDVDTIQTATLLDSLNPGVFIVTGADINASLHRLALLCYGKLILFQDFAGNHFSASSRLDFFLPLSQSEGIAFGDGKALYYSNEEGDLYRVNWPAFTTDIAMIPQKNYSWQVMQENDFLLIRQIGYHPANPVDIGIYNLKGQQVFYSKIQSSVLTIPVAGMQGQLLLYCIGKGDDAFCGSILIH